MKRMLPTFFCRAFAGIAFLGTALAIGSWGTAQEKIDYSRQIKPLFARKCFQCHGAAEQEAGLRLDQQESATSPLDSDEIAIVPGKPLESELLARIETDDEDLRMPPEGKPLSPEEIETVKKWIAQGAEYKGHWAFQPIKRPEVPKVKNGDWTKNPIDYFVLQRLEKKNLSPAKPAGQVALIRRAYYDLTGLPPTPQQVAEFVADKSPNAFEKVVDQLLESPQYGERWARHWLDLVRYAETNGYERDSRKELIWKYRDYVIRSFNEDKSYDRFLVEQLAGDEVADKTGDSITATGIYRLGIWDDEPADRELARYDYLDDIVRTTGESVLGMTIGCARCHDHKIDPISQKDYYSMLAFFADISPHGAGKANHVPISTAADKKTFAAKVAAKKKLEEKLASEIGKLEAAFLRHLSVKYPNLKVDSSKKRGPKDGVILADSRKKPQVWRYSVKRPADHWFQIAFDDSKWKKGPGGFGTKGTPGSVVRTAWNQRDIWMRIDFGLTEIPAKLMMSLHHDEDVDVYLNGKKIFSEKGYITDYKSVDVTAASLEVLQTGKNVLALHCRQTGGGQYVDVGLQGDFGASPTIVLAQKYGKEVLGEDVMAEWNRLRQQLTQSQAQKLELKSELAMAVAERGNQKTWILGRGNPSMKGDEVTSAFPSILNPPVATIPARKEGQASSGKRTVLANWIVSQDNPMTSRVAVNRIWQNHFGRGLVRTSSDFGFQGMPPTHPLLLDWLATEFMKSGWQVKKFHKLIMMSATYQMSSAMNQKAYSMDPTNDLLWRFDMRRLSAEEIRDSILSVSGTLNLKMFGPSIYPPLPKEVLATASRPNAAWGNSSPEDAARRTIYVHVKRSLRPPMLANFDVPDTDSPCAVRMITTVPTQALGMLNSKFLNEQAELFAKRLREKHPDDLSGQISLAIQLTTGRIPSAKEIGDDLDFVKKLMQEGKLSQKAAMQNYALMILNTNEFFYLD